MPIPFKYLFTLCAGLFLLTATNMQAQVKPAIIQADSAVTGAPKKIFYGQASYYANKFHGQQTANGEIFRQDKFTAACNVLPLNTWIRVTNLRNGKTVIVRTTDRLHPKMRRLVDLSRVAAEKLGYISQGLTRVKVEVLDPRSVGKR
ncbi:MAG TPA: septal ring lytic transglycosylase RlpA family protein [Ferruginibacter sp.]|nr:septal ring lytic transglycosylase RlpA family protein [Ferruginibacter sp.]